MKRKKKQVQRNFSVMLVALAVFFFYMMMSNITGMYESHMETKETEKMGKVADHGPALQRELAAANLEEYTVVLAAIMYQESKGAGGDPMQSSESIGQPPNTITDPNESIRHGVAHFKRAIARGENKNVDFATVIQSYNMGLGYIDFVSEKGGKHSEALAKEFSSIQVKKNPELYNCNGDKNNFRYPYCYGDFSYSTKVASHMDIFEPLAANLPDHQAVVLSF